MYEVLTLFLNERKHKQIKKKKEEEKNIILLYILYT